MGEFIFILERVIFIKLINGECLEELGKIKSGSVDMILTDLPYGTTACEWDNIIPFNDLWTQYNRVIKDNGAIILFATQPFTTKLIASNIKNFKYNWYWKKNTVTGFCFAKYQPMRNIEDICVFYKKMPTYNPQGLKLLTKTKLRSRRSENIYGTTLNKSYTQKYTGYPNHLLEFKKDGRIHPTQKPVALCEYLIKTYTNENDTVLDSCMGSGTTGVACKNTNRHFIGIELNKNYFDIAEKRILGEKL